MTSENVAHAARALHAAFHPNKVNYGAYGDTGCHLHMHLVPKYEGGDEWGGTFQMNPDKTYLQSLRMKQAFVSYPVCLRSGCPLGRRGGVCTGVCHCLPCFYFPIVTGSSRIRRTLRPNLWKKAMGPSAAGHRRFLPFSVWNRRTLGHICDFFHTYTSFRF